MHLPHRALGVSEHSQPGISPAQASMTNAV